MANENRGKNNAGKYKNKQIWMIESRKKKENKKFQQYKKRFRERLVMKLDENLDLCEAFRAGAAGILQIKNSFSQTLPA